MYFFFFNDTATTEIYTLSLHDALPISIGSRLLRFPYPPRTSQSRRGSGGRRIHRRITAESTEAAFRGSYGCGTMAGSRSSSIRQSHRMCTPRSRALSHTTMGHGTTQLEFSGLAWRNSTWTGCSSPKIRRIPSPRSGLPPLLRSVMSRAILLETSTKCWYSLEPSQLARSPLSFLAPFRMSLRWCEPAFRPHPYVDPTVVPSAVQFRADAGRGRELSELEPCGCTRDIGRLCPSRKGFSPEVTNRCTSLNPSGWWGDHQ